MNRPLFQNAVLAMLFAFILGFSACQNTTGNDNIVKYSFSLSGENQTTPVPNAGTGTFTADYDKTTRVLKYSLSWSLTGGEMATLAHFHGPADAKMNAGIAANIFTTTNTSGKIDASITLTEAQAADMLAGKWYINIHSSKNPTGAIRGQFPAK